MPSQDVLKDLVKRVENGTLEFLEENSEFVVGCDQCGKCCRDREDILLSPHDVFHMVKATGMQVIDMLKKYTEVYLGPTSNLPIVRIVYRKELDGSTTCPFLGKKDNKHYCRIHEYKPYVCRSYPLGRMTSYADKYCTNSVGFEEEALKAAVCRALSKILQKRDMGFELVKSHLVYVASADEKSEDLFFVEKAIKDEENRIMEYAKLGQKSEHNKDNYQLAIADCKKRIKVLREKRKQVIRQLSFNDAAKKELERIEAFLSEDRAVVDQFDDSTIRRLVNSIHVTRDLELIIYIKGGYEVREKYLPLTKSA